MIKNKKVYRNEDFFQVFGHISIFFATLDLFTTLLIFELIDKEKVSRINITDKTTLKQKFRILENLKDEQALNPLILKEIKKIIHNAINISEKRNRYIHDQWIFEKDKIPMGKINRMTLKLNNKINIKFERAEESTIYELYEFLKEIGDMQKKFGAIYDKIRKK